MLQLCYGEHNDTSALSITLECDKDNFDALIDLMNKPLKVMVNGSIFNLSEVLGTASKKGEYYRISYDTSTNAGLKKIFMTKDQTHRFYCTWAD